MGFFSCAFSVSSIFFCTVWHLQPLPLSRFSQVYFFTSLKLPPFLSGAFSLPKVKPVLSEPHSRCPCLSSWALLSHLYIAIWSYVFLLKNLLMVPSYPEKRILNSLTWPAIHVPLWSAIADLSSFLFHSLLLKAHTRAHTRTHSSLYRPTDWIILYLFEFFETSVFSPLSLCSSFSKCSLCTYTVSGVEDTERINTAWQRSACRHEAYLLVGWGRLDHWQ